MEESIQETTSKQEFKAITFEEIAGLRYFEEIITREEEKEITSFVNSQQWNTQLKRRTQHYGYQYDYTSKKIDASMKLGELPDFALRICERMKDAGMIKFIPDQMIINEYLPGQGISPHIDRTDAFGDTIFSISMNSQCLMNFSLEGSKGIDVLLKRRSVAIMQGDARYKFKHGIVGRKSDKIGDRVVQRGTRLSLTFRKIRQIPSEEQSS